MTEMDEAIEHAFTKALQMLHVGPRNDEHQRIMLLAARKTFKEALAERGWQVEQGWQPIESAPRDGSPLDLCAGGERIADAYWGRPIHECGEAGPYCDCCPDRDGWCDVFGYITGDDGRGKAEPSHWRPLPPAPPAAAQPGASSE